MNLSSKFFKYIKIHGKVCKAFIDCGSDCSILKQQTAETLDLEIKSLDSKVTLSGFLGIGITVTKCIEAITEIDDVKLTLKYYVVDNHCLDSDVLIGRNFTENKNIIYYRIDDNLTFKYRVDTPRWLHDIKHGHLSDNEIKELYKILLECEDCVFRNLKNLGKAHSVSLSIELKTEKPVTHRPYRCSDNDKTITRKLIGELLNAKIIRESSSPYASPSLLVNKKDGSKRLVIDYRSLNKITTKNSFPMPIIKEIIDNLSGFKYFTNLDMAFGYHQISVDRNSIPYTAFVTSEGHYEYVRMPFGLCNAPSVFQQFMNEVLKSFREYNIIPYLDDILIPSKTVEDGLNMLKKV